MQVSRNFNSVTDNMQCPCCNAISIDQSFIDKLQLLRDLVSEPFYFDRKGGGFFRCRDYNISIKGATNSFHLLGRAGDILTHGWSSRTKAVFVQEALRIGLSVFIYSAHFHIDMRSGDCVLEWGSYS